MCTSGCKHEGSILLLLLLIICLDDTRCSQSITVQPERRAFPAHDDHWSLFISEVTPFHWKLGITGDLSQMSHWNDFKIKRSLVFECEERLVKSISPVKAVILELISASASARDVERRQQLEPTERRSPRQRHLLLFSLMLSHNWHIGQLELVTVGINRYQGSFRAACVVCVRLTI